MLKIHKKSFFIFVLIILLFFEIVFSSQIPLLKYADEVIAVLAIVNITMWILQRKNRRLTSMYRKVIWMLGVVCVLGFCGNIFYKVCPSFFAATVDCLGVLKSLMVFIFVGSYLSNVDAIRVTRTLYRPSKLFLWLAVFFGIVSIFIDIGMGGEVRFGMRAFSFIFDHAHVFAIVSMCALILIAINERSSRSVYLYTVLTCICQFLTTKGPSIIWSLMIFVMFRYYVHNKKVKPWLIVVMIVVGISVGGYQITNYFMNATAPRALFLKYGITTANEYFPLGSGFATYGSEMAKDYYSKLYYEYGFNNIWGMTEMDGRFLNDNYWPMIIAQTGYIGGILFFRIYYKIFKEMQQVCSDRVIRAILITNYIYIMVHSIGSASLTGMEGEFLFAIFGVVVAIYKNGTIYKSTN